MKILFIENKYKTKQWEIIGSELEKDSHEIYFLVQNHFFSPSFGNIYKLPYPKKKVKKKYSDDIKKVINSCRGMNYFNNKSDDYIFWYDLQIRNIIDDINPDLVFGESTLFHELLTINYCRKKEILYLNPSSCRYPPNRFSFYMYDTLETFGFSNDEISHLDAVKFIDEISNRKILPDYMKKNKEKNQLYLNLIDKLLFTLSYYCGEKYNTPSPINKIIINKTYRDNINLWEKNAYSSIPNNKGFNVLYALQMQPEANIDVWGYSNRNQIDVVKTILESLGKNDYLLIKPNPKSKYEISKDLIELINKDSRIIHLSHSINMNQIWDNINLVITVTGTVAMECIFSNKPVAMFFKAPQFDQKNCIYLDNDKSIINTINLAKENKFPRLSIDEKIDYLKLLIRSSYEGINGDGFRNNKFLNNKNNLGHLFEAYRKVINDCI